MILSGSDCNSIGTDSFDLSNLKCGCKCKERFTGDYCERCEERFTGDNCDQCKERFTGEKCEKCKKQYKGTQCEECNTGYTGANCDKCKPGLYNQGSVQAIDCVGNQIYKQFKRKQF